MRRRMWLATGSSRAFCLALDAQASGLCRGTIQRESRCVQLTCGQQIGVSRCSILRRISRHRSAMRVARARRRRSPRSSPAPGSRRRWLWDRAASARAAATRRTGTPTERPPRRWRRGRRRKGPSVTSRLPRRTPSLVDRAEHRAARARGCRCPCVHRSLHPSRNRDGADMASLAGEIGNDPVVFPLLD